MNKNTAASLVSGILAFIMMISISVLAMIICFALTLFNINYVTHKMDDRYFDSAINSLNSSLKNEIAPPSGFPEEVFDGLINKHLIKEDSVSAAKSLLLGTDYIYNSSRVRDIFITRFTQFAEDEGISFTKANLNSLTEYCLEEYERQINISFLKSFAPVRRIFDKYYTYGLLLFSALLITATLFLFKVNRFKHRAVRYCVYSLFASSLIIVPLPLVVLIQGGYRKINIIPEHIKMLFVNVVQSTLLFLMLGGLLIALIGFLLIPMVKRMKKSVLRNQI